MKNKALYILGFALGVPVGALATWKVLNVKYEQRYQEELQSLKESLQNRKPAISDISADTEKAVQQARNKPSIKDYAALLAEGEGYINHSTPSSSAEIVDEETEQKIYTISPEEFGEREGFETVELTLYSDGVLENDDEKTVDDVQSLIGSEALDSFGEYEDDSVYVRNEKLKLDIQILYDEREYSDLVKHRPPEPEEE